MKHEIEKPQRGRPPLPAGEARSEVIRMRATPAEKEEYERRGGDDWLRRQLARKTYKYEG